MKRYRNAAISGIAGIGHILLGVSMVLLPVQIKGSVSYDGGKGCFSICIFDLYTFARRTIRGIYHQR